MANKFNNFLGNNIPGSKGDLGSYQHAARLYVDDNFRLAPRVKFLYYVVFNINSNVAPDMQSRSNLELNYLVRSTDLPKFTIETELFNQYNKKVHTYKKINYMPVNMILHDDNDGTVNAFWALYNSYYFADRGNNSGPYGNISPPAYQSSTYDNKANWPFRYGLDNDSDFKEPFLHSVQLITISRQQFNSYLLCSPKITAWDHDNVAQDESAATINHRMTLVYDAVLYSNGYISEDDPAGWGVLHYDKVPSPLVTDEILKNGIEGVFDEGRLNNTLNSVVSSLSQPRQQFPYDTNYGNQIPFGYGSQSYYGQPYYPPLGGIPGVAFGLASGAIGGAINAGIGLLSSAFGNNSTGFSGGYNQSQSDTNTSGVASPTDPGGTKAESQATDAYSAIPGGGQDSPRELMSSKNSFTSENPDAGNLQGPAADNGNYGANDSEGQSTQDTNSQVEDAGNTSDSDSSSSGDYSEEYFADI